MAETVAPLDAISTARARVAIHTPVWPRRSRFWSAMRSDPASRSRCLEGLFVVLMHRRVSHDLTPLGWNFWDTALVDVRALG